jgi:hypothetical protein
MRLRPTSAADAVVGTVDEREPLYVELVAEFEIHRLNGHGVALMAVAEVVQLDLPLAAVDVVSEVMVPALSEVSAACVRGGQLASGSRR